MAAGEFHITLKPQTVPAHKIPYRKVPQMRAVKQSNIDEKKKAGVTEAENSEWQSPVVLAT